jgi:RNA polymerase sigma factor (sigma-70 family)
MQYRSNELPDRESAPEPHGTLPDGANTSFHVRGALHGDERSWSWIVSHLSPLLEMQASYRLPATVRRYCDPKDLVNDAWMIAFSRMGDLRPRNGRFTPVLLRFLSSTLLRRVNDLIRTHIRRTRLGGPAAGLKSSLERNIEAQATSILGRAARSEARHRLAESLDELSAEEREVVVLLGIEQLANKEVAKMLGVQPSTLSMRYQRAREKLRRFLPDDIL